MTYVYGGGNQSAAMYYWAMDVSDEEFRKQVWDKFRQDVQTDLNLTKGDSSPGRILAACQDTESNIYLLIMAVPASALNDPESPDLWRTPTVNRFIVCLNEDILKNKVDEIENEKFYAAPEEKNEIMANFIAGFLPAMFERAYEMGPLDI